jgi:hypothetical protein
MREVNLFVLAATRCAVRASFSTFGGERFLTPKNVLKVFMDDFYVVCEEIILGPFPTHLGGTRLGTRLGETRMTGHPATAIIDRVKQT